MDTAKIVLDIYFLVSFFVFTRHLLCGQPSAAAASVDSDMFCLYIQPVVAIRFSLGPVEPASPWPNNFIFLS